MESLTEQDPPWIGGYELRARLGEGGFGLVYLALSPAGRAVAVKVLQREFARNREFLARFRLEVAAAQQVNGIYTAPVVASGLDDRPPWVATAFVPGPPLDHFVSWHGSLPEPALWRLLAGLVEALQAIHACGIVHRDLKPANVLLAADGPRVIDFGISKAVDGTAMTSTGSVFGTPSFMAPEQAEGRTVSPATDVFALGCTVAYASTGVLPFGGGNAATVLYRIVHGAPVLEGVPTHLRSVIERCLAKEPTARPSLTDLASVGRDGPVGGLVRQSPASFWPPQVATLIRKYQERLDSTVTARTPIGRHSAFTGVPGRSFEVGTHPPTAVPLTPPSAQDMRTGGPVYSYAPAGPAAAGIAYPGTGQPRGVPLSPQIWQPPFQPAIRPVRPGTIRAAFAIMLVGAALAALSAISVLFDVGLAYRYAGSVLFSTHGDGWWSFSSSSLPGFLYYLIECGLWVWVATAVNAGHSWTRAVGTILLAALAALVVAYRLFNATLYSLAAHFMFVGGYADYRAFHTLGGLLTVLIGLAGCAVVVLLWLPPSGQYFRFATQNHGYARHAHSTY